MQVSNVLNFSQSVLFTVTLCVAISAVADDAESLDELRDPTQPLNYVASKVEQARLELQAILVRGTQREAVINGQQVRVGNVVKGAEILSIDDKSVMYRRKGATARLYLRASVIERK